MGDDFIQKAGKPIKVALDRDLAAFVQGDLFTRNLQRPKRFALLQIHEGYSVSPQDELMLEMAGDQLVAVVGNQIVGHIQTPSAGLRGIVRDYGVVSACVDEVHASARVADIEILE